jgi:hypothetical protein
MLEHLQRGVRTGEGKGRPRPTGLWSGRGPNRGLRGHCLRVAELPKIGVLSRWQGHSPTLSTIAAANWSVLEKTKVEAVT